MDSDSSNPQVALEFRTVIHGVERGSSRWTRCTVVGQVLELASEGSTSFRGWLPEGSSSPGSPALQCVSECHCLEALPQMQRPLNTLNGINTLNILQPPEPILFHVRFRDSENKQVGLSWQSSG